jgi:hypothetical protein
VQQQQPAQQQPAQQQPYAFTFQMDEDTHKILGTIPDIYRNFIINFGIKLAAEQEIYQNYLTNYFSNETGEITSKNISKKTEPTTNQVQIPAATAGFSSW